MTARDIFNSWLSQAAKKFLEGQNSMFPAGAVFWQVLDDGADLYIENETKTLEEHFLALDDLDFFEGNSYSQNHYVDIEGSDLQSRLIIFLDQFIKSPYNNGFLSPETCVFVFVEGSVVNQFQISNIESELTNFEAPEYCPAYEEREENHYEDLSSYADYLHSHVSETLIPKLEAHLLEVVDTYALHKLTDREQESLRQRVMNQIRSEEEARIRREVQASREELKSKITDELRSALIEELKEEMRPNVAEKIRDELMRKMLS